MPETPKSAQASDERWMLTQRVLQSEVFRRAHRLQEFLTFVVQQTLGGRASQIDEYEIATHVFGRSPAFNSAEDTLVRSSARQLRAKLHEYFETAGQAEPFIIELPKGGYVPEFVPRPALRPAVPDRPKSVGWRRVALFGGVILGCLLALWIGSRVWNRTPAVPKVANSIGQPSLASWVVDQSDGDINVIVEDAALVVVNSYRKRILTLEDYIAHKEQTPIPLRSERPLGEALRFPGERLITPYRDTLFAERLGEMAKKRGWSLNVRHSRLMHAQDLRTGVFVLLGNPWSNPWTYLFESRLNFQFVEDPTTGQWELKNKEPRAGELAVYTCPPEIAHNGVSWARLAMLPNLTRTGLVFLVAGLHAEGFEAAADAALSPEFLETVKRLAGRVPLSDVTEIELVLEVKAVDGTPENTRIIASRFTTKQ